MAARFGLGFPCPCGAVHFVHSKESQGQTEPCKGEAIFLRRTIELLTKVDFGSSRIRRDNRIVFLCGGKLGPTAGEFPSVREALLSHLPSREQINGARIILAERATEALPGSNFTNLLDLEEYISAAVDRVILIVESAGSICELGAFVKTPEISDKLLVVISSIHNGLSSFIKLGALKYLSERNSGKLSLSPFNWTEIEGDIGIQGYVLDAMVSELEESIKQSSLGRKFDDCSLGDR